MNKDIKIDKNVPLNPSRKGSKYTNPLYEIAKKMQINDSVKFVCKYFETISFEKYRSLPRDEQIEYNKRKNEWDYATTAPHNLKRYIVELYGKGSCATRQLRNVPYDNNDRNNHNLEAEEGIRVWRIK